MIPYFEQPSIRVGPLTIYAFGIIVAASVLVGFAIGGRRFRQYSLDARLGEQLGGYVVACGFLGAHLFAVLFYFPEKIVRDPLILLRVWEDLSSFGGIVGAFIGLWLFFRLKGASLAPVTRWAYVDVAAYVFPMSLAIGRIGCALAHDHPGRVTSFPLAVSLESASAQAYITNVYAVAGRLAELPSAPMLRQLGFHDLGLYELLYLAAIVVPVTLALARKDRAPGTFLMSFVAMYMPVRFALDFLRVSDARYAGLTPAQWMAMLLLAALPVLSWRRRRMLAAASSLGVVLIPVAIVAACRS